MPPARRTPNASLLSTTVRPSVAAASPVGPSAYRVEVQKQPPMLWSARDRNASKCDNGTRPIPYFVFRAFLKRRGVDVQGFIDYSNNHLFIQEKRKRMRRRQTISEHQYSEARSSVSHHPRNSRLIAEYNNLESSYERSRLSPSLDQSSLDHPSQSHSRPYSNSNLNSNSNYTNSQQTLKNKKAHRVTHLEPTGQHLVDNSYFLPQQPRVRSFLNSSLREASRPRVRIHSGLDQSDISFKQNTEELITLPQPGVDDTQLGYLIYLNRHRGMAKPYDFAKQVMKRNQDISVVQEMEREHPKRFEEAKLRYLDNMVPKKMRVGNDPLRMYKYRQRKRDSCRLMQFTEL